MQKVLAFIPSAVFDRNSQLALTIQPQGWLWQDAIVALRRFNLSLGCSESTHGPAIVQRCRVADFSSQLIILQGHSRAIL